MDLRGFLPCDRFHLIALFSLENIFETIVYLQLNSDLYEAEYLFFLIFISFTFYIPWIVPNKYNFGETSEKHLNFSTLFFQMYFLSTC